MNKEEQMRAVWEQWRVSGKSRSGFAREHQIPINTFQYWCRRFEGKRPTAAKRQRQTRSDAERAGAGSTATPAFVEIATTAAPAAGSATTSGTSNAGATPRMRFELPDGTSITIY